jgi:hypothetical protein
MMLFPPREATTTAEPPEPLYFSAYRIHYMQTHSSEDWRPGGEAHWCPVVSIRGSISIILAAAWPLHEKSVYSVFSVVSFKTFKQNYQSISHFQAIPHDFPNNIFLRKSVRSIESARRNIIL